MPPLGPRRPTALTPPKPIRHRLRQRQQQRQQTTGGGAWDAGKHPRAAGGRFGQSNTAQSQARDRAVAQAQRHGDPHAARAAQSKYEAQWHSFLSSLPAARAGMDVKAVANLVREARKHDDAWLAQQAQHSKDPHVRATYEALLKNRQRVRQENLAAHPLPHKRAKSPHSSAPSHSKKPAAAKKPPTWANSYASRLGQRMGLSG